MAPFQCRFPFFGGDASPSPHCPSAPPKRGRVDELTAKSARANPERRPLQVRFDFRARSSRLSATARAVAGGDLDAVERFLASHVERVRAIEDSPPWCVECRLPMLPRGGFPACACESDARIHREAARRARRLQILENFLRSRDREIGAAVLFSFALAIERESSRLGSAASRFAAHLPPAIAARLGALVGAISRDARALTRGEPTSSARANSRARKMEGGYGWNQG